MESDKVLLALIQNAVSKYDEADELVNKIEEYCNSISEKQQKVDFILSDIYHEIENDDLDDAQMAVFGKEIKKYRRIRRNLDNANIIRNAYEKCKNKLPYKPHRPFFTNSIEQVMTELNQPYQNRVLTEEEIKKLKEVKAINEETNKDSLEDKKLTKSGEKKVALKKAKNVKGSVKVDIQELKKEYLKGTSQTQLAIMFGCTQPTINYYIKKIKKEGEK